MGLIGMTGAATLRARLLTGGRPGLLGGATVTQAGLGTKTEDYYKDIPELEPGRSGRGG